MPAKAVVIIGAGIGGLATALELAAQGIAVTVFERAEKPGGKMRQLSIGAAKIDAGPTVFTMRWVFEELFARAGLSFSGQLGLKPAGILARHAWSADERLDLHADLSRSADAIGDFANAAEARRFLEFSARARKIYQTLERPFIRSACASPQALMRAMGTRGLPDLWRISPFVTMWRALGDHFHDPRLRQLFGRYATYCGSSPFLSPATLMLVAHVEQDGVWLVEGGMHRLAVALEAAAVNHGTKFRYSADVSEIVVKSGKVTGVRLASGEEIAADAVVVNGDAAAVSDGFLGRDAARAAPRKKPADRSLSAVTWALVAETEGFPLSRHNVFFSGNYAAEFDDIFKRSRLPVAPTVYVCAQDRGDDEGQEVQGVERLLCLVNAPPKGDTYSFDSAEITECETRTFGLMERCGLRVNRQLERTIVTTPTDFNRLFPATGGALYGPASHGWTASFNRPGSRTRIPGLYLAGGSTHPGPGVPMAALSGTLAAASLMEDLGLIRQSRRAATPGGMSTV